MSTDNNQFYDIRLDSYQLSIISGALLTFISEGGFQGKSPKADLEEASALLHCLGTEMSALAPGVINDLRPED